MLEKLFFLVLNYFLNKKLKPKVINVYKKEIKPLDIIGANPGLFNNKMLEWKKFTYIIEHHSFTKDSQVKNTDAIWKYHTSYRIDYSIVSRAEFNKRKKAGQGKFFQLPWRSIGYNALVEEVNNDIVVFKGRPLTMSGGHCQKWNDKAIGICLIGEFDSREPSSEKYEILAITTKKYMRVFDIPIQNVLGHGEANKQVDLPFKSCPGKQFNLNKFRDIIISIPDSRLIV